MKVLVFSDSHGRTDSMVSVLGRHPGTEVVLHLGDYGTDVEAVSKAFPSILTEPVRGNNDRTAVHPLEKTLCLSGKRIFLTHGHVYNVGRSLTSILDRGVGENADVILFGHTHVPLVDWLDGMLVVNPGCLYRPRSLAGYTYAILEITRERVNATIHRVSIS